MSGETTLIVGMTGQTGAGKSTVADMFRQRGVQVIDADSVAHTTMENTKECLMDLVIAFSTEIIYPDATLNRERLAQICFSDPDKLKLLNKVVYPYILAAIEEQINALCLRGDEMILIDAPTLYESGLDKRCDRTLAVLADKQTRIGRIIQRDSITEQAAQLRADAQNPDTFYTARADDIIKNDGAQSDLQQAFDTFYDKLRQLIWEKRRISPPQQPETDDERRGALEELSDTANTE